MFDTSASLLERIRVVADPEDWRRLVDLYSPLIRSWLRRHVRHDADSDDLVQDVLAVVVRRLPDFRHNGRTGAFRAWLRAITVNCLRDAARARRVRPVAGTADLDRLLNDLDDPESELSQIWDREHDLHVTRSLLEQLRPRIEPATWAAFERVTLAGEPAEQVASALGVTVNAVYIAKSRVLAKLRQEAAGLLD